MGGRPCSICSHRARATIDARLAAGDAFQAVGTAMNVSVSALKRHKHAGHVAEAVQAHAEARSVSDRVRELDDNISAAGFSGNPRQQLETLRDHGVHLLRRSEARGDDRSAIASAAVVQRALDALTDLDQQSAGDAGENACPSVIIFPHDLTQDQLQAFQRQLPGVLVWLPDNQRGDSATYNGVAAEGDPEPIEP